MPPRFPQTWQVDPEAHYWRVRRRSGRALVPRSVVAIVARLRRRHRPRGYAGAAGLGADGIPRGAGHVRA